MKMLIIGGSGLLGYKTAKLAVKKHEVYTTYRFRPVKIEGSTAIVLDKCDRKLTFDVIHKIRPDVVVDTAALHNVDYCETHREEAWKVNVEGTRNVAAACKQVGARMIFTSTDYVFDGKRGYYTERDTPNPLNYYAKTKFEAENMLKDSGIDYLIVRPSVIYGWNPSEISGLKSSSGKSMNFAIWALQKLRDRQQIQVVTDQYGSPTLADNLAEVLMVMIASGKQGIYHTAGKSCVNRYEFALKIAETFGIDKKLIKPVTSYVFKQIAERPKKCCLDISKVERNFRIKFLTVEQGLSEMKGQESLNNNLI